MLHLALECAIRAALIALGTAVVLSILRVKSARARHAAWTAVVLLMLLLPAWMAWGAKASLRVLPAMNAAAAGGSILFPAIAAPTPRA
jgi:zinc transporter ZupT